ncbi:hypothetical protein ASD54_22355 [Rhizobium sp. Root149]|uniref:hypothetical protein n=1 Tax=Rhizobium sp. Root149 TaxID=1736473 RepID=UPI0007146AAF|nr:hypothetical protein [Rhizobium sp. Root149]KQZ62098.1 hypothetical protein ASD54_22355 [Rhizobium sp. Root149]
MLPKKGSKLPTWPGFLGDREVLAFTVADLLKKEHGDSHRAIKELMRQTGASERTVKHWLSGQHAPEAMFFLRLVVSSPVMRAFVLGIIEGPASEQSSAANDRLLRMATKEAYAAGEAAIATLASIIGRNDPDRVPESDLNDDPEPPSFNQRQQWFVEQIKAGKRLGAKEIVLTWHVSLKTARRDISALLRSRLLEYVGSRRKGRYRRSIH